MNAVKEFYSTDAATIERAARFGDRTNYAVEDCGNWVYANIWMAGPDDVVEMYENGKPLKVVRLEKSEPLILAMPCLGSGLYSGPQYQKCYHLFGARASSADAPVVIRLLAPDGTLRHEEVMERPKAFSAYAE